MPQPSLILDPKAPPGDELQQIGRSIFNLFPQWDVRLFGELDSTNSEARRLTLLMGGDAWPRIIMTDFQFAGRGRQGREWIAPRQSSLLMTAMAPTQIFRYTTGLLPLAVALWVVEGLERLGLTDVKVKWPNDVLLNGKKVCGILCETSAAATLIGVGVNLQQDETQLPERRKGVPPASSVQLEMKKQYPGRAIAGIQIMSAIMESIEHQAAEAWVLERYRQHCATIGSQVIFNDARAGELTGIGESIDPTGALVVRLPGGELRPITTAIMDVAGE